MTDVIAKLRAMRNRHGTDSAIGNHCALAIKQIEALASYVRPEWATYEIQTLHGKIKRTIGDLARMANVFKQEQL